MQELSLALLAAHQELAEKSADLCKVISERNALRARLSRAENSARELSCAFRTEAELRAQFVEAHRLSNASLRERIVELERALSEAKNEPKRSDPGVTGGLRRIRGIGPAYERALLALGITTVAQIAALSRQEVVRIAPLIKAQIERIERDDWLGQAQRLVAETSQ